MKPFFILIIAVLMTIVTTASKAEIKTQDIEYKDGGSVLQGIIAYDDAVKGPRPVVIVVHEWWGINDYIRGRIKQLAQLGYLAFAADIYGKGIRPKNQEEAMKQTSIYRNSPDLTRSRVRAALDQALKNPMADKNKVAAMGYCFGGGVALELARSGAPVNGVVCFHGNLATKNPADAKNIKGKVLVLHGGSDPNVKLEDVLAFEKEMRDAGVDWQVNVYGGAVHAFTNPDAGNDPSKGAAYNAEADKKSWQAMKEFFAEIFK